MSLSQRKKGDCIKVITLLAADGHETRFAGGCVRDSLLGIEPSDFDLATTALPQVVSEILGRAGYKVIPTGIDHGTVTVVTRSGPVEITTLRVDRETDGRRAKIDFVEDFQADGARRDFTINAMFQDAAGQIFDYFGGQEHLRQREIHFVGDAAARISEDYLRILRFFRFLARFHLHPDPATIEAIRTLRSGLDLISQERITAEWRKTLEADGIERTLELMVATGVYQQVFPGIRPPSAQAIADLGTFDGIPKERRFLVRQAFLLHAERQDWQKQQVVDFAQKCRLPVFEQRALVFLINDGRTLAAVPKSPAEAMDFIDAVERHCGANSLVTVAMPLWAFFPQLFAPAAIIYVEQIFRTRDHLRTCILPLTGQMLMQHLKIGPGPNLGRILTELRREFRNGRWRSRDEGLAMAESLMEGAAKQGP